MELVDPDSQGASRARNPVGLCNTQVAVATESLAEFVVDAAAARVQALSAFLPVLKQRAFSVSLGHQRGARVDAGELQGRGRVHVVVDGLDVSLQLQLQGSKALLQFVHLGRQIGEFGEGGHGAASGRCGE